MVYKTKAETIKEKEIIIKKVLKFTKQRLLTWDIDDLNRQLLFETQIYDRTKQGRKAK